MTGRVLRQVYTPGLFLNAELDKASDDNERNALVMETPGTTTAVVQIAGLVARRIKSFVREGETLGAGDRFGLIRFGSRLDVYLPAETSFRWSGVGQTAIAGRNRAGRSALRGAAAAVSRFMRSAVMACAPCRRGAVAFKVLV